MATTNVYQSIFEIAPKIFVGFFNRTLIFVLKETIFEKKILPLNLIFCVYNVVLDILILDFFPFLLIKFFKNSEVSSFFCRTCFFYALINVW